MSEHKKKCLIFISGVLIGFMLARFFLIHEIKSEVTFDIVHQFNNINQLHSDTFNLKK